MNPARPFFVLRRLLTFAAAALAASLVAQRDSADPDAPPDADKTLSPYFWVKSASTTADPLPLKSTRVDATVAGVIADVRVTQVYANTGTVALEAIYVFPGSTRAAVHGLTLVVGERRIEAEIRKRVEARQVYETAKAEGKTASLLEQQRPNVFQMNVANILPGDTVSVELRYTELLTPTDGVYEFVYPGVVGPRYSNTPAPTSAGGAAPEDAWVGNPYLSTGEPDPATFDLAVTLAAGLPIQDAACATHRTQISFDSPSSARLTLDPAEANNAANRDFILRYRLAGGALQAGVLLARGAEENFFLAMIQPPARPAVTEIPARDYLFIVDVSGSMHGFPIATTKTLMRGLLPTLRPQDTFNVLLFAGGSRVLAPTSLPATPENIRAGLALLDREGGGGSTELLPALRHAFTLPRNENVSRTIALITDGYVSVETEAFELIRTQLGKGNVFAFGIGASVNRHLIEGLARAGLGEPFIVTDERAAEMAAGRFREMIAAPVLTGVSVEFADGFDAYDVEPRALPDVFAQRPVILFGKWRGTPTGKIVVRGATGAQPFAASLDVAQAEVLRSADGLTRLWARHKIAQLADDLALQHDDARVEQVTALGLKYALLTKYTSFVAVDHVVRRSSPEMKTVKQPLPLPQGVSNNAVGGTEVPTSPEPATIGLLTISTAALGWVAWRRKRSARVTPGFT